MGNQQCTVIKVVNLMKSSRVRFSTSTVIFGPKCHILSRANPTVTKSTRYGFADNLNCMHPNIKGETTINLPEETKFSPQGGRVGRLHLLSISIEEANHKVKVTTHAGHSLSHHSLFSHLKERSRDLPTLGAPPRLKTA